MGTYKLLPSGSKFGRWTTTGIEFKQNGVYVVPCVCECGTTRLVNKRNLVKGRSVSCGCFQQDTAKACHTTHNMSRKGDNHSRVYNIWALMKARCLNPNNPNAKNYLERGITVCERWLSFENFLEDMGEPPTDKHTLERVDNEQGYCLENCKWATRLEQGNNRRTNILVTYQGRTKNLKQWAVELGISYAFIKRKYHEGVRAPELFKIRPQQHKSTRPSAAGGVLL